MIVCAGEALVDILPGADVPVPGGGPMNTAVAAARQGSPAAFLGRLSTDPEGDLIAGHLRANGVDLRCVERGPEPTARAIVEIHPELSFRFEGRGTADTALERADLSPLGPGPHFLHGGTLGMFRGRTAEVLADLVGRCRGIVSLDPNVRPAIIDDRDRWRYFHRKWLNRSHIYKLSDEDLEWIWPRRRAGSVASELLAGGRHVVLVTRGGQGADVYNAGGSVEVPAPAVTVVDTVGAGDTFAATVLVELWRHLPDSRPENLAHLDLVEWSRIAHRAVGAAAITCTRPGADPPTLAELDGRIPARAPDPSTGTG